jgi:hypothetical protein
VAVLQPSPLVMAAVAGRLALLDGAEALAGGTLASLQALVADRAASLPDGTRLVRADRYDAHVRAAMRTGLSAEGVYVWRSVCAHHTACDGRAVGVASQ